MITKKLQEITLNITDGKHGDCEGEDNSGYYFISCKDVHDGIIHYDGARQITEKDFIDTHRRTMLEPNDILVTNSGTIGRMALVKENDYTRRTTFQKSVAIVKPNQEMVRPAYLYYCLLNCVNQFVNQSNGSAQKNLLLGTMRNFEIRYEEDFSKQDKVIDVLQSYDNLIENNQRQIKLLEEAAQRLYKEWFVDLHFPGYEDAVIIDGVPEGWEVCKLGNIVAINSENISKNYPYSHIEYVDLGSVRQGHINETTSYTLANAPGRAKRIAQDGDTIWGMVRPNLRSYALVMHPSIRNVYSTGFAVISPKKVPFTYLYCLVTQDSFIGYLINCTNGAAYPAVKPEHFEKAIVLKPNDQVLGRFHEIAEPIFRKIENLDKNIVSLAEARDRLLPKLMSGEIEV